MVKTKSTKTNIKKLQTALMGASDEKKDGIRNEIERMKMVLSRKKIKKQKNEFSLTISKIDEIKIRALENKRIKFEETRKEEFIKIFKIFMKRIRGVWFISHFEKLKDLENMHRDFYTGLHMLSPESHLNRLIDWRLYSRFMKAMEGLIRYTNSSNYKKSYLKAVRFICNQHDLVFPRGEEAIEMYI